MPEKPKFIGTGVELCGVSACVPTNCEDNSLLDPLSEKARNEFISQVGIRYRHVAPASVTSADLCLAAAEKLLSELNWNPEDIGLLIFVTQTPDHLVPGTATQLQSKLGLSNGAIALDINQGCAGYVYGLSVVTAMMQSFGIEKALLLVGDTITKMVSKEDNSIWPIFSDAGSATALRLNPDASKMTFKLGSKGSDFEAIHIPDGGYRFPIDAGSLIPKQISDGIARQRNQLSMNGQAVFTFGLSTVARSIQEVLLESGFKPADFDHVVLHQANQLLNNSIVRKTGFSQEQAPSSLFNYGNTSCATIPITLVTELGDRLRNTRLRLLLCGFGVGLSWGNVILETDKIVCPPIIRI
jgi:3-oxoacyl-[acyl-carrier-protein] synthase-3